MIGLARLAITAARRRRPWVPVKVSLAALAVFVSAAHGGTLDGITVVRLSDPDAAHVIHGATTGNDRYLVMYISAQGTYASLGDRDRRHCVAWASEGSYTGSAITFGVPATPKSIGLDYPYVCQPFTVTLGPQGRQVRIDAVNPVGMSKPLEPDARQIHYSRRQPVLARVPLTSIDWGQPAYRRFTLHGVPLGPWPQVTAALAADATVSLSPLKVTYEGARRIFVSDTTPNDRMDSRRIMGDVLDGSRLQWPWDVLFGARLVQHFPQTSTLAAFDEALAARYGAPTLLEVPRGATRRERWWLFDLQGRPLPADREDPDSCLATKDLWDIRDPLSKIHEDLGPWNCALVAHLRDDASVRGTVSGYELEVISGYGAALNHFTCRLAQLRALRDTLRAIESRDVEL